VSEAYLEGMKTERTVNVVRSLQNVRSLPRRNENNRWCRLLVRGAQWSEAYLEGMKTGQGFLWKRKKFTSEAYLEGMKTGIRRSLPLPLGLSEAYLEGMKTFCEICF